MQAMISVLQKYISWLNKSEGIVLSDKLLLFFVKLNYISLRIILLVLGKKRRNRLIVKRGLDFGTLWKKYFAILKIGKKDSVLLKFKMPKYNYEFYCRKNKDDFKIMTFHEDDIMDHNFTPKEGDIVIDIGAHIGPYTIIASKRVGPNGKVISIEADPDNFDILNRNINLNKLINVIAVNYAVYSKEETIKLYLPSGEEHSSYTKYNTVMSDRAQGETKFVQVQANTLDYILQKNGIKPENVNWIKIDVEGAEFEVLKGARDVLSNSSKVSLLIEIHNLSERTNLYKQIKEFLNLYSFTIDYEKIYQENGERHIVANKH
ncbi:MAG: FkbM family methyltransferase [Nitrososphaeraceae archaeon]